MNILAKLLMGGAILALSACNDPSSFDNANGAGGAGSGTSGSGLPSDPTSVAYFQEAIGDRVLFEVDQATITDVGRKTLDGQAKWLITNTDFAAVIEGHADEQGTREYNLALGARRANAAREYLISRGIAGNRLKTVSYGKERPIEICSEESCYARNRRAVTVLAGGLTS